jgi:hypothetical protein
LNAFAGHRGIVALAFGWLEVTDRHTVGLFVAFAWFANPLLLVTWILASPAGSRTAAIFSGSVACCLCLGYILFGRGIVTDESGSANERVSWTIGYAFWLLSVAIALFRAILCKTSDPPVAHDVV